MSAVATIGVVGGWAINQLGGGPNTSSGDAAARASEMQSQISWEQWQNYKQNYMPLEQDLIAAAKRAGSEEEIAAAEGRAAADVTGAFERANRASVNRMRAYGINPASPAFGSDTTTTGLAEGAAMAGARTQAGERQRELGYSKLRDIVSIGRGIPAQSAASAAGAASSAGIAQSAINSQYAQNLQNQRNIGYALQPLVGAARNYYYGVNPNLSEGYAEGGEVGLARHGLHPKKIHLAVKGAMTPHMRRYANGGGVGNQGLEPAQMNRAIDGPGTETSDSIPANIDGQNPAALSTGEFVMTAEVPKMTGEEILQAINRAGLEKRQGYACGGKTSKHGLY